MLNSDNLIPVKENSSLRRELYSNSIINTDKSEYLRIRAKKDVYKKQREEINSLKAHISSLENRIKILEEKLTNMTSHINK